MLSMIWLLTPLILMIGLSGGPLQADADLLSSGHKLESHSKQEPNQDSEENCKDIDSEIESEFMVSTMVLPVTPFGTNSINISLPKPIDPDLDRFSRPPRS